MQGVNDNVIKHLTVSSYLCEHLVVCYCFDFWNRNLADTGIDN